MSAFAKLIRRLLSRKGYVLHKVHPAVPPSLTEYIGQIIAGGSPLKSAICFDNEPAIQKEISALFPCALFLSPPADIVTGDNHGQQAPSPGSSFLLEIDGDSFPLKNLFAQFSWASSASLILVRHRYGFFSSESSDFGDLEAILSAHGFLADDVFDYVHAPTLQNTSGRVVTAFVRRINPAAGSAAKRYRVNEARTFFVRPLAERAKASLLAGRGSFGYGAGVCNPGAILTDRGVRAIARGEAEPWSRQKTSQAKFYSSCTPLALEFNADQTALAAKPMAVLGHPGLQSIRLEDFRLFRWRDKVYSNHSVISSAESFAPNDPVSLPSLQTKVGVAEVDFSQRQLNWLGFPKLDLPTARTEKNWAIFSSAEQLYLLYSFAPYRLLAAVDGDPLHFKTVRNEKIALPFEGDGISARNSINPVDYDSGHWLHLVHRVYPGKQYSFWPVLISKETLLPAKFGRRPLVCGWRSFSAAIHYVCSAVVTPTDLLLFGGLDDSASAIWRVSRDKLESNWTDLFQNTKSDTQPSLTS